MKTTITAIICLTISVYAQRNTLIDTSDADISAHFAASLQVTGLNSQTASLAGFEIGIRAGGNLYVSVDNMIVMNSINSGEISRTSGRESDLTYGFAVLKGGYIFYESDYYALIVNAGSGAGIAAYINEDDNMRSDFLTVSKFSCGVKLRLTEYLMAELITGYRFTGGSGLRSSNIRNGDLSSLFTTILIRLE